MKAVFFAAATLAGSLLAASSASALPPPAAVASATVADIESCMRGNYAKRGSLRDVAITAVDADNKSRQLKVKLHWKPSKDGRGRLNLRVVEPLMLAGSAYLLVQNPVGEEVYFHLPAAGKTQKVNGDDLSRPLWGTDFSYNDVKLVQGLIVDGSTQRVADAKVDGRPVYMLDTSPKPEGAYTRVLTSVDQDSCVILKAEFTGKSGKVEKIFTADTKTLSHLDPFWFATHFTMQDLVNGTHTDLTTSDVFLLEKLPEKAFDPATFFEPLE